MTVEALSYEESQNALLDDVVFEELHADAIIPRLRGTIMAFIDVVCTKKMEVQPVVPTSAATCRGSLDPLEALRPLNISQALTFPRHSLRKVGNCC